MTTYTIKVNNTKYKIIHRCGKYLGYSSCNNVERLIKASENWKEVWGEVHIKAAKDIAAHPQ